MLVLDVDECSFVGFGKPSVGTVAAKERSIHPEAHPCVWLCVWFGGESAPTSVCDQPEPYLCLEVWLFSWWMFGGTAGSFSGAREVVL